MQNDLSFKDKHLRGLRAVFYPKTTPTLHGYVVYFHLAIGNHLRSYNYANKFFLYLFKLLTQL